MLLADWKNLAAIFQSIVTPLALVIGGWWAYRRYIVEESNFPHIETSAEISLIGQQGDFWIVELVAVLNNKGKVQHKIEKFAFDLNALYENDPIDVSKKWAGQINFPHEIAKGSFIPKSFQYFVVGPSVTARYSYIARVPASATYLILHCSFDYADGRGFSHTMEKTIQVPAHVARPSPTAPGAE
ncbi:hypothetical protein [Bradyrhizobium sp. McL0615]|uniref:hypothetical protein n=1 Tax=Bradyrhizobium sp. McL0615 TaxID=3415673 RepID=UPI003CF1193A